MSRDFPQKPPKKSAKTDVLPWQALILRHSPYLTAIGAESCAGDADKALGNLLQETHAGVAKATDADSVMRILRIGKRRLAALTAAADLSGAWDDVRVMQALSDYADAAVSHALDFLLRAAHNAKVIKLPHPKTPQKDCGVTVIALGKWGARELNYSSDIDLMVIFDPLKSPVKIADGTQNFFIRLTRDLARLLDAPTGDGYVFRTDLRLRPDPGAMPLAISIAAAEVYYGTLGQNWERAAMIKARPMAGDDALGADFLKIMRMWIWRKNLDFAAIQDIHSIKRQINAAQAKRAGGRKPKGNPFLDFNVKLGHGGIREIEFFAQTQQLIFGGREPALRDPRTLMTLGTLAEKGQITATTRDELVAAYLFLRRVEHRLQMQDDRQTHSLPSSPEAFDDIAHFAGYDTPKKFLADLEKHTGAVRALYAGLFTEAPSLSQTGNLVFTGVEDDPETLVTLAGMGFVEPEKITAAVRGWHHGRYRAVRSERARQILTEITPHLLATLGATPHPDDAFIRFDQFLSRLPSGIPIFSMFQHNPQQMELVADIMGGSPALAEHLGTHPQVLDGVLSRDFFGGLPDISALKTDLRRMLQSARDYQDVLDMARRWAREKRFHAGIHILKSLSPPRRCAQYLSDIAESAMTCLLPFVEKEFAAAHGVFKTGEFIVLAMGSFAAQEMYADSDLDIIALYKTSGKEKASTGAKPLAPNVYYIRLMQRLISAMSAPTAEGILYDVDARLRPAGNDGPLAAQLEGFFEYHKKDAWVWEHMSLIRSRLIYATDATRKYFTDELTKILSVKRDDRELRGEMLEMRAKVEKQFGSKDAWQLKYRRGGLMDVLFAVQFLILQNAHKNKGLFAPALDDAIKILKTKKLLAAQDAEKLSAAHHDAQAIQSFLRLCAELPFDPEKDPPGLKKALAESVGGKKMTFKTLAARVDKNCKNAFSVYKKLLDA
ncbi:MAG: bifunctional [glutamine synthetase] adenylyltransferase/[glutamine synthetase]-adenylyl-L-tyrosine phosphorylase [Alphaproteobacteria bacterium]|nr:bifunctional [glutamine synthetase] adenylyltransferase/[glutamine synthetase]-adenylyl-L-tyrosine phosphorylase [Alphaproteobacteria bacterium]